jgi:hypothetical protein
MMAEVQAPVRLEFFYGRPTEDPFQWLESFELFIEVNQVEGDRVLRFVKHAMREEAYTWYRANQDDILDWEDCKEAFLERFGLDEDTLMSKVDFCMQQTNESVRSYADRFRKLMGYLQNPLPVRMVTKLFVKGLVPHLKERVQMTYPGNGALAEIIRLAANYEKIFGHEPIGAVYSNQNTEVPPREKNVQWRRPIDNGDQRATRPPQQQYQRENARDNRDNRNWQRQRDFPERRNQQQLAAPPRQNAPINPPREAPAPPPVNDIDTLTREMEKLRIQIAELQRPQPAANYTNFVEHGQSPPQQPTPQHATMMYDGFDDPFWPSYATKRPAEAQPEADPPPLRRRPNNLENTTVDPRNLPRPAAPRPTPVQHQQHEPRTPAAPPPAPAREPAPRPPVDLGGLPPLPNAARPAAYRRPVTVAPAPVEPIQQIKGLPMKLTVQSYLNHVSEEEFNKSIEELRESREHFLRNRQQVPPHARATNVEVVYVPDGSTSTSGTDINGSPPMHVPQSNLQRNPVNTTVATVPIIIKDSVFEEGIIDTGATNTMISQSAARQLNLIDQIEPSRLRYSCADGKMSSPWGIIRKLPVGVEGLVIPIDVFVSGATSYDVLLGTDWLTQAHAEISFAKQEMSFRIEPHILGRVPITVMPASKSSNRYCITQVPELDFGGPAEHPAHPGVPMVPAQPEVININDITSDEEEDPAASQDEVTSTNISDSTEEEHYPEYEIPLPTEASAACNAAINIEEKVTTPTEYPDLSEEWSLKKECFNDLNKLWGPFDIDACCDTNGLNAKLPQYWSPLQDCLQQIWTHKKVYCNPPYSRIDEIVSHCLVCHEASPHTTSAVLVLPCWPDAPWFSKVSQQFHVVKEYPKGSEIAIDIGCSPEEPDLCECAIPWPIIVVSTHAATRMRDPSLPQVIAVPAEAVKHQDISLLEVPAQPKSATVESEVVNPRLPTQPRDEHSPDSLQHTVYNMCKLHFDNNSFESFIPPTITCPRFANANLCSTIDSDHFGPTFLSARVICPSLEPVHFKVTPPVCTWSARPSLGWTHKCCSVLPRVSEMSTRLKEMIRKE